MKKQSFLFIMFFFISMLICQIVSSQDSIVSWNYPILPGSNEQKSTPGFLEKLSLLNIPAHQLNLVTTDELTTICINYPFFGLVFTRNNLQEGYEFIKRNFNGFKELESRTNAALYLLEKYEFLNPKSFTSDDPEEVGKYMAKFTFIELLLAQADILKNCDKEVKKRIVKESIKKINEKADVKCYGIMGTSTTAFVMGRALNQIDSNSLFMRIKS